MRGKRPGPVAELFEQGAEGSRVRGWKKPAGAPEIGRHFPACERPVLVAQRRQNPFLLLHLFQGVVRFIAESHTWRDDGA